MRLYSGADYLEHIEGVYNQHTFPKGWQSDFNPFTIDVGSNGTAVYEIHYVDIEDLETPQTVNADTSEEFQVGRGFDINMDFIPGTGYKVEEVKLELWIPNKNAPPTLVHTEIYGSGTTNIPINDYSHDEFEDQSGTDHYYKYMKCYVTFEL